MARHPRSRALWGDASPLIKRRVQAAVPQLHFFSNGLTRELESSARIPRFHTSVEAVTPPWRCRREDSLATPRRQLASDPGRTCHARSDAPATILTVYPPDVSSASTIL